MKVRPLHDRLLVRRIEEKETAKGGIIIPDTAKEKPQEGEVLAVGNGKILENGTKIALDVKVGDKILFGKYSGNEIKIDGEEVLIVREDEVLAVIALEDSASRNPVSARPAARAPHLGTAHADSRKRRIPWRSRSRTATSRGRPSCAASTAWPTPSR